MPALLPSPVLLAMIVATAGHVDHGKTTLIKALTGVDTDRLPEEKLRGLSVDLGFAFLVTNHGLAEPVGFIDVPGHEKFIRNMIAGVGSIDIALLVVAADDGPMPQTHEHLAILQLLAVKSLIVVLTKTDLVDSSTCQSTTDRLRELLDSSAFPAADIVSVAAGDEAAVGALKQRLIEHAGVSTGASRSGGFRLAIDRSFTVPGAGTVVTGNILSGAVQIEDSLFLLSREVRLRVRGIRAQNENVAEAVAGQRCALNVSGSDLKNLSLKRGDWLTSTQQMRPVRTLDVSITPAPQFGGGDKDYLKSGVKHWTSAHLHLATATVSCRIALLDCEHLKPGEHGLARLFCEQPLGAVNGDRFVLRDQSARYTIAGGIVIDPLPPKRGRSREQRLKLLRAMGNFDRPSTENRPTQAHAAEAVTLQPKGHHSQDALAAMLTLSGSGVDLRLFGLQFNTPDTELHAHCKALDVVICDHATERWAIVEPHWSLLQQQLLVSLDKWHDDNPNLLGASAEQLGRSLPQRVCRPVFFQALDTMVAAGTLVKKAAVYKNPACETLLDDHHESLWQEIHRLFDAAGDVAPRVTQLAEALAKTNDEVLRLLNIYVAHGRLYRVSDNRYYTPTTLLRLAGIAERLADADDFTVAAFRDVSGIGRNLVIELLEFFDRSRFTRRVGQKRVLLQSADSAFEHN